MKCPRVSLDAVRSEPQDPISTDFTLHLGDFTRNGHLAPHNGLQQSRYPSCHKALDYLQTIGMDYLPQITSVYIPVSFMASDDGDNIDYADSLILFLTTKLALDYVSLEVPDDMDFGHEGDQ